MQSVVNKDLELRNYKSMEDEEIVEVAKEDNSKAAEYLILKYHSYVKIRARSYYITGADSDDIVQEGLIGLYKAIQDYDKNKLTSFRSFAELCIRRQIITAIKAATRQKHIPLNSYISLNKPIYEDNSSSTLLDIISGMQITNPENVIIINEEIQFMKKKTKEILSELEQQVLMFYIEGLSYEEMAQKLDRHVKSIDNALQRAKKKLDKYFEDKEETYY